MPDVDGNNIEAVHKEPATSRTGRIVILNGAPRSGKSSIVAALQQDHEEVWVNLGVDLAMRATPPTARPGIGLRPGGERPDLEPLVESMWLAWYDGVAAHARHGINVVVDAGHHDEYSARLDILPRVAARLLHLPVLVVGVRCPLETIMARRDAGHPGREGRYLTSEEGGGVPAPVARWQRAVHQPGIYDLEVDTSTMSPGECAAAIRHRLGSAPPPGAIRRLAGSRLPSARADLP